MVTVPLFSPLWQGLLTQPLFRPQGLQSKRGRLTQAERYDTDGTTLLHRYSYTYDDGDNMLTKAVLDAVASVTTTTAFAYTK